MYAPPVPQEVAGILRKFHWPSWQIHLAFTEGRQRMAPEGSPSPAAHLRRCSGLADPHHATVRNGGSLLPKLQAQGPELLQQARSLNPNKPKAQETCATCLDRRPVTCLRASHGREQSSLNSDRGMASTSELRMVSVLGISRDKRCVKRTDGRCSGGYAYHMS